MRKKWIPLFLLGIVVPALIWYLFIKPYDYLVTFKAKALPGTIAQTIKLWGQHERISTFGESTLDNELLQTLTFNDSLFEFRWKIIPVHDSLSKVKVYATDGNHSLRNKMRIPFSDTDFEKRTRKELLDFNKKLKEHLNKFRVTFMGEENIEKVFCACTELKTSQYGKAAGMMRDYPFLSNFLVNNGLTLNGSPRLEVIKWHRAKDSIEVDFCFPIVKSDTLPQHPLLKYRVLGGKKALKAIYNGNYITSDRAWYTLLHQAKKQGVDVKETPVEVFHNNPNTGGGELSWKAEIYMPLMQEGEKGVDSL
ncbi:MAG: AraC family transcriptional regulator [Flavobacteriaceae bacterium]